MSKQSKQRTAERRQQSRKIASARGASKGPSGMWLWGGVAVVAIVAVVLAVTLSGRDDSRVSTEPPPNAKEVSFNTSGSLQAFQPVQVQGTPLPKLADSGPDPAVGKQAPVLDGKSFDGSPVQIAANGKPTMVVFFAHWCPQDRKSVV